MSGEIQEKIINDLIVVKRSGQRVEFNNNKIALAIKNAFDQVRQEDTEKDINKVYEEVLKYITNNYVDRKTINVEDIQDIIETKLKEKKYEDVYFAFRDYRIRRAASRKAFGVKQQHKFSKAIERIINSTKETFNDKPNEILLDFGKTIAAEYTKTYVLDNKSVRAHEEGSIYIHNLDYFNLGKLSSTHLIWNHLINQDFPTNFIVEALNAKNEIDGEIAIDGLDQLLEPLVRQRFKSEFKKILQQYLSVAGYLEYINMKKICEILEKETSINFDTEIFESLIYNKRVKDIFEQSYNDSMQYLLRGLESDIQKIVTSLDLNYKENPKYVISLGSNDNFEGLIINNCYLKVIENLKSLKNVTTIFQIKKDSNIELLNKISELIIDEKNIALSFIDNSYNRQEETHAEYFSNGRRIFENQIYDDKNSKGRMLVSSVTINMGRLGLKYKNHNRKEFWEELNDILDLSKNALVSIFETIGDKNRDNYQIIFNHNILDDDKLEEGQKIRKVIKKGALSIEMAGLYECATCLEEQEENRKQLIYQILEFVDEKKEKYIAESNLNFIVSETEKYRPLKKLMELDKAIYGIQKGVTDKNTYGRMDAMLTTKTDIYEFLKYIGKCQKKLSGGCLTEIHISKNTSTKKIIEYINTALDCDVGFLKLTVRK